MNFLRNVQGPPHGVRPKASDDDDNEEDDRKVLEFVIRPNSIFYVHLLLNPIYHYRVQSEISKLRNGEADHQDRFLHEILYF